MVLNRDSGTLRELWHEGLPGELEEKFGEAGVAATVRTEGADGLDAAIDRALAAAPDALVVGGGDGTVAGAATRLTGGTVPLGVLPLGTFNLAARDLGVPLELDQAVPALARAPARAIDVLQVGDRACLCTALAGFYPRMAEREEEFHGRAWWKKSLNIARKTFRDFHHSSLLGLKLETLEGERLHRATRFAAFVPGDYEDIFSVIPKRVKLTDGEMTVYISRHRGLFGLARASLAYLFGMLRMESQLERVRTRGVRIGERRRNELLMMIDGEILRLPLPLEIRVRERALKVLRPTDEK